MGQHVRPVDILRDLFGYPSLISNPDVLTKLCWGAGEDSRGYKYQYFPLEAEVMKA